MWPRRRASTPMQSWTSRSPFRTLNTAARQSRRQAIVRWVNTGSIHTYRVQCLEPHARTFTLLDRAAQVSSDAAQFAVAPSETVVSNATQPPTFKKPRIQVQRLPYHGAPPSECRIAIMCLGAGLQARLRVAGMAHTTCCCLPCCPSCPSSTNNLNLPWCGPGGRGAAAVRPVSDCDARQQRAVTAQGPRRQGNITRPRAYPRCCEHIMDHHSCQAAAHLRQGVGQLCSHASPLHGHITDNSRTQKLVPCPRRCTPRTARAMRAASCSS